MTRIRRKALGPLLLLTLALASCRKEAASETASAGNASRVARDVVLITIDTLRYDAVGFDGNPKGTTPNLDRFAAEGRVFSQAHSHNVITLPSHTNILTGMLPYQHGVRENAGFRLSPKTPTVATRLKAKGYVTGAFIGAYVLDSRYGLGARLRRLQRDATGTWTSSTSSRSSRPAPRRSSRRRSSGTARRRASPGSCGCMSTIPTPRTIRRRPTWSAIPDDPYLGEVAYTDASLAPLLEEIRSVKPAPLLVVTGDHGEGFGDHGELTHGLFCYEATLHVPLFDLVPRSRRGRPQRRLRPATSTSCRRCSMPSVQAPQKDLPGQSLLPAGRVEAPEGSYFEALSAAFNRGWAPLRGIASDGAKYIDLPIQELYELPKDPAEENNLAPATPDALRRLRKRLLELPATPQERGTIGSEEAAKLRSLGYLTGSAELKTTYGPADDPKTPHQGRSDDPRSSRA